jgi:hypothetical protein
MDAAAVLKPLIGVSQIEKLIFGGIHSTKGRYLSLNMVNIASSISFVGMIPRNYYRPILSDQDIFVLET